MTISVSPDRVDEIQVELEAWCNRAKMSCKQLESLKLQFASQSSEQVMCSWLIY